MEFGSWSVLSAALIKVGHPDLGIIDMNPVAEAGSQLVASVERLERGPLGSTGGEGWMGEAAYS